MFLCEQSYSFLQRPVYSKLQDFFGLRTFRAMSLEKTSDLL